MNKPHPLQAAVCVARSREDDAVKRLAEVQQRLLEQQKQLQQLIMFRGEYAIQFENEGSGGGITARRFQDYAAFLNSLDHGITESRRQLEHLRQELQHKRQCWVEVHAKTKALEEVVKRDRKAQSRREDQREQRDSDERNLRGSRAG
ncbi:MAG: flagellar export protein FliJ [Candidatus Competibacter sp.]|nr:flagellar export protein FliJ [Candidatus Competibacter sp.]